MVTRQTRSDVWRRLFDAERLHLYYSKRRASFEKRRTLLRNVAAGAAAVSLVLGVLSLVVGDGASKSWLAAASAISAIVAATVIGYEVQTDLTRKCLVLSEVSAEGLAFISETNELWSDVQKADTPDADARNRLMELERRGRELSRRINDSGIVEDAALAKTTAESAKKNIEARYATSPRTIRQPAGAGA